MITYDEETAAEKLGISKDTLYRLRRDGKVPHARIGEKTIRYTDDHLRDFINRVSFDPSKPKSKMKRKPK